MFVLADFEVSNLLASTPQWGLGPAGPRGFLGGFPAGLRSFQALNCLGHINGVTSCLTTQIWLYAQGKAKLRHMSGQFMPRLADLTIYDA